MAANRSRKRATKFVPPSQRFAHDPQRKASSTPSLQLPKADPHPPVPTSGTDLPAPHSSPRAPRPGMGGRGKLALVGGGAAAVGGGAYLVHRHQQKKAAMSKNLVDPFSERVVFGKAYPIAEPVPRSVRVAALLPTGRHVGHANDLKHIKIKPRGHRQGPFSKGSVADGLKMAAGAKGVMPLRTPAGLKPTGALTSRLKLNSKMPDAARQGRKLA